MRAQDQCSIPGEKKKQSFLLMYVCMYVTVTLRYSNKVEGSLATLLFLTCDTFETNAPWGVWGGLGWLGLIWSNSVRNNLQQDRTPGRSSAIDFHSRHSGPAPGLVSGVGWGGCNNVPDSLRTV